jgi:hypothetical protein
MESALETADVEPSFIFYVDDNDPTRDETLAIIHELGGLFMSGPRVVLSEMWNVCAQLAQDEILMHCGDDIVFRTPHWDTLVSNVFDNEWPDKIGVVHGRDGFQDQRLATHGFYHRRWIEVLGRLVPPYFSSDYNDLWNTEVADAVGRRRYIPEIYTEHMHPVAGKAELDQTHQERLTRHTTDNVEALYTTLVHERLTDIAKLRSAITNYAVTHS